MWPAKNAPDGIPNALVYSKVRHWHQQLKYAKIEGPNGKFDGVPVRVICEGDSLDASHGCLYDRESKRLFYAKNFDLSSWEWDYGQT